MQSCLYIMADCVMSDLDIVHICLQFNFNAFTYTLRLFETESAEQ